MNKNIILAFALSTLTTISFATPEDGVPMLGDTFTDGEEKLVRDGARLVCEVFEEFELREQCALDYYASHNYQGEPDCDD